MLAAASSVAMADATFRLSDFEFWTTHRTSPIVADFTNNDLHDIFYGGQGYDKFNTPGWYWQIQQNFCVNNGDGTFTIDGYDFTTRPGEGENGNDAYDRVWNQHGIIGSTYNQYAVIDFNNDGLLDLLMLGDSTEWDIFLDDEDKTNRYLYLYENLGEGKFRRVEAGFPGMKIENDALFFSIAVGDYDRDGYVDFAITAADIDREEGMPSRTVSLYRNIDGTGTFQDMKIAETKGGVYDAANNLLEGYFLPASGNIHMVDINNDGWLDIVYDGWADNNWDPDHNSGGNVCKIYINENGECFRDATPADASFYSLRNSTSGMADFDHDGYLDYLMTGWGDNGFNWNTFLYTHDTDGNLNVAPKESSQLGLQGTEKTRIYLNDFDGDGLVDVYYNRDNGGKIFFGNSDGTFREASNIVGNTGDSYSALGDFNNNGLADIFVTGYGINKMLYLNESATVESPETPGNVTAEFDADNGMLNIAWDYDIEAAKARGLAYNIFVKKADGSIYSLVPANPETGFVKVGYNRNAALRPNVTEYSIPAADASDISKVGVQAISLDNMTYSEFAVAADISTGVGSVALPAPKVSVNGDALTVEGEGAVAVYDIAGRKVAAGLAGQSLNVTGNGIFVVVANGKNVKVIK